MKQNFLLTAVTGFMSTACVACAFGLTMTSSQALEVYKSTGSHGEVQYTQHRPRNAKNVKVIILREDGRQVDTGQMAGKTDPDQPSTIQTAEQQQVTQLQAQLKDQQAQAKAQRCQSLRNNLTNLNVGDNVYEMNKNGSRKYLDNHEVELKRERIQKAIEQYCNNQSD